MKNQEDGERDRQCVVDPDGGRLSQDAERQMCHNLIFGDSKTGQQEEQCDRQKSPMDRESRDFKKSIYH